MRNPELLLIFAALLFLVALTGCRSGPQPRARVTAYKPALPANSDHALVAVPKPYSHP